jgi:asparagine synthase (glutamine-hydrolysing)
MVFNRLSIMDVAGGRQPVSAAGGRVWGVVNGEIFNHLDLREQLDPAEGFGSRSDSEVWPHAWLRWGLDFPSHLNGMFAGALVDERTGQVVLVRDRVGVKPLYVHESADAFYFASEIKALLAHPAVPRAYDWPAAMQAIGAAHSQGHEVHPSFFQGIEVMGPGTVRVIDPPAGRSRSSVWWRRDPVGLRARDAHRAASPAALIAEYRELLEDAVRLRLMGDVEYGLFLSGGIDSVAIAALAARHASAFHCFSVVHPSTVGSGDLGYATQVADHLGLPFHPVQFPSDAVFRADDWKAVVWACELHLASIEQFFKYHLHAAARRARPGLKVILLGQGSDEFTGGYTRFMYGETWAAVTRALQVQDLRRFGDELGLPAGARGLGPVWLGERASARAVKERPTGDRYWTATVRNLDYHLWLEDRVSSANSIEARVPFLDVRLIELLLGMPIAAHEELLFDKAILRRSLADVLPASFRDRPKGPFFYGPSQGDAMRLVHRLIRADGGALIDAYIGDRPEARQWIDVDMFRALLQRDDPDSTGTLAQPLLQVLSMAMLAALPSELAVAPPVFQASDVTRGQDVSVRA